uniref:Uncharacterized protein n=2 Tax=Lygus hesperus TaxID=30085 RepID=A0A0A9VY19_LYGHE
MDGNYHAVNHNRVLMGMLDPVWTCDTLPSDDVMPQGADLPSLEELLNRIPSICTATASEDQVHNLDAMDTFEHSSEVCNTLTPLDRIPRPYLSSCDDPTLGTWVDDTVSHTVTLLKRL